MGFFDFLFNTKLINKSSMSGDGMILNQSVSNTPGRNVEFSSDVSANITKNDIIFNHASGVQFINLPDFIKLVYSGILAENDADKLYAVIGYGDNNNWEDTEAYPMHKTANKTFEILARRKKPGNVNVTFKDGAGNWDNNFGQNYVFLSDEGKDNH